MRKLLLYLLVIIFAAGAVTSCRKSVLPNSGGGTTTPPPSDPEVPQIPETDPPLLTAVTKDISPHIKGYYKALPAKYGETNYKYPVIIFFHGGGQFGNGSTELSKVLYFGIPKMLNDKKFPPSFTVNGKTHSFIIIMPQFSKRLYGTEIQEMDALLAHVEANFRIDPKRIYMSGFSLGARALTDYAAMNPSKYAAVTSMGGAPIIDTTLKTKCQQLVNGNLPIWHFHNRDDAAWAYSESERYIQVLNEFSPAIPPRFTTFDVGEGKSQHDCWTRTSKPEYKEDGKNIYEWMLSYTR